MNKKVFLYACLVPAVIFLFFLPSLFNGFVNWDDPYVILENPLIGNFSWQDMQTILVKMWTGQYHRFIPFSMVLFAAEHHFFGTNPFGYHLISVLLHSFNSLGVFILIYLLTARPGAAIVAALLFGLHPLAVQPVEWVAAETYPVCTFFFLGSVISYVWSIRVPLHRARFEALAFIIFLLALLFYSQLAMPLPFILLAIDYYLKGKIEWGQVLRKTPFLLLTFYFGWLALKAAHHVAADFVPFFFTHHLSLFDRLNLSSEALWMYVQKFVIPHPLSCYYPVIYYSHGKLFLYSLMGGATHFAGSFRQQIGLRTSFLGLAWFLLTSAPFLHIYGVSESIINDRYFYIPSIGLLLMLIGFWESLRLRTSVGRLPMNLYLKAAAVLWFILVIFFSYQQIGVWQNSGALWDNFLYQYPGFPDGYLNRSEYYLKAKKPLLALRDTDILLKLAPRSAAAYVNRGHAFFQLHQWRREIEAYNKAIEFDGDLVQVYVDRGAAYFMLGEDDLAMEDYNRALQKDLGEVKALLHRGLLYYYRKEYPRALVDFQKAVLINPGNNLAKTKSAEIEHILAGN